MRNNSGYLVEHEDGRQGIAYDEDQIEQFTKQNKFIVKFFIDNDMKKGLNKEKRSVKGSKLKLLGYID